MIFRPSSATDGHFRPFGQVRVSGWFPGAVAYDFTLTTALSLRRWGDAGVMASRRQIFVFPTISEHSRAFGAISGHSGSLRVLSF